MEIAYPMVIVISIPILIFVILKKVKRDNVYVQGKKVANAEYTQRSEYYKELLKKYKVLTILIKIVCVISILISIILTARIVKVDRLDSDIYNRDIFLCMDVSTSVDKLNLELVDSLKSIVDNLHGERFGICIFNTSNVVLVPLTDDYKFVNETLDTLHKSFEASINLEAYTTYYRQFTMSGTVVGNEDRGSSIIGDGLASCVLNFPRIKEDRTRIIIFSTDNDLAGEELYTLSQAGTLAKNNKIIVFGIAPESITSTDAFEMRSAVEKTGGKFYTETGAGTVKSIVSEIDKTGKSMIKTQSQTRMIDYPEVPFVMLLTSVIVLYILNKKVNL